MERSAQVLRRLLLVTVVLSGVGVSTIATSPPVDATSVGEYRPDNQECKFLRLINNYRRNGDKLDLSASLGAAAEHHSRDMARKRDMFHSNLDRNVEQHGYDRGSLAENVGFGSKSAEAMLKAWQGSRGHDRNMRDGSYKAIGIARVKGGGTWYWTTIFGSETDRTINNEC